MSDLMPASSAHSAAGGITIRIPRRLAAAAVVAAVAFGLVGVGIAGGTRLAAPTAVAVVDYNQVLSNLAQRQAMMGEIETMSAAFEAEGQAKVAVMQELFEQMKVYDAQATAGELDAAGEAAYEALRDEFRRKDLDYKAWEQRSARRLDWEKSYLLEKLFQSVNAEIATVAAASGYDVVLSDDSGIEPQANRRQPNAEAQLASQMRQRRILYAARTVDISQDVIDRLNNAWNAGG
jgi:Skp family chaperone for outer membrane proteins